MNASAAFPSLGAQISRTKGDIPQGVTVIPTARSHIPLPTPSPEHQDLVTLQKHTFANFKPVAKLSKPRPADLMGIGNLREPLCSLLLPRNQGGHK